MATKFPSYGVQEYWDDRFRREVEPHDWLQGASILDTEIAEALAACKTPNPQILHIGGGTSELSFNLRMLVKNPRQVHNADFSAEAIAWGIAREKSFFGFEWDQDFCDEAEEEGYAKPKNAPQLQMEMMRWTQTSLLDLKSVISTCKPDAYSVVVDKTCCDAVACAGSMHVRFPYPLYLGSGKSLAIESPDDDDTDGMETIHPLHFLAIHLALVTRPGARWIALSFSKNRFPFLPSYTSDLDPEDYDSTLPLPIISRGFPDSARLWTLISKDAVPESKHWVYVLERTSEELKVRGT